MQWSLEVCCGVTRTKEMVSIGLYIQLCSPDFRRTLLYTNAYHVCIHDCIHLVYSKGLIRQKCVHLIRFLSHVISTYIVTQCTCMYTNHLYCSAVQPPAGDSYCCVYYCNQSVALHSQNTLHYSK